MGLNKQFSHFSPQIIDIDIRDADDAVYVIIWNAIRGGKKRAAQLNLIQHKKGD
jgi:hypothetical protein